MILIIVFELINCDFTKTSNQVDYFNIFSVNGGILSKIICLIYQFDFVSIYNAVINDINPTPVNSIDFIKSKLRTI